MDIDRRKLEVFDRMARSGATGAAGRFSGLLSLETAVESARLSLISAADIRTAVDCPEAVAISIGLTGDLEGEAICVFDQSVAQTLAETFMPMLPADDGYTSKHEDALGEICNVTISGYIDGWANHREEAVVMDAPQPLSAGAIEGWSSLGETPTITQRSTLRTAAGDFELYFLVTPASATTLFGAEGAADALDSGPLEMLKRTLETAAPRVGRRLERETDTEIGVDSQAVDLVPTERLSDRVSDAPIVGTVVEFNGGNSYLLALFDPQSAQTVAGSVAVERDADDSLKHAGQLIADTVLGQLPQSVAPSVPRLVEDMQSSVLNDAVVNLGPDERFALTVTATLAATDRPIECELYMLFTPTSVQRQWS